MKIIKSYTGLLSFVYFPLLLGLLALARFFPQPLIYLPWLNWIFLGFCGVLLVSPLLTSPQQKAAGGRDKENFPQEKTASKMATSNLKDIFLAFAKICFLQCTLILLFLALNYILIVQMPWPSTRENIAITTAWQELLHHTFSWSLFPWTLYAMIGITIAYYQHQQPCPPFLTMLAPILKRQVAGFLGMGAEIFLRYALLMAAMSLSLISYGIVAMLLKPLGYFSYGTNTITLIVCIAAFFLLQSESMRHILKGLWKKSYTLEQLILVLASALIVLLLAIIPIIQVLLGPYIIGIDLVSTYIRPQQWHISWIVFCWSWWLVLTPVVAWQIAKIIKNLSIPVALGINLLLPVIVLVIATQLNGWQSILAMVLSNIWVGDILIVSSWIILMLICWFSNTFCQAFTACFHTLCHQQKRLSFVIINRILMALMTFALLFLFLGLSILYIMYFIAAIIAWIAFLIMGCGMIKVIGRSAS